MYETTVNLLDTMQLQTVIHLDPLRYGQVETTSDGKPILKNINLFLFKHNEVEELGPDLVCEGQTQYLRGYVFCLNFTLDIQLAYIYAQKLESYCRRTLGHFSSILRKM